MRSALTLPPADVARPLNVAVVLAHGAGSDMDQPLLRELAEALARRGALVLRFNFAYADAGRGAPDRPPMLLATYRAAVAWLVAQPEAKGRALVLGGKSMGGRMASHLAAQGDACDGLYLVGYPLHPAGRPEVMRDAHLPVVPCPMLFLAGTRDPLCDLAKLEPVLARIGPRAELVVIEGGDHSFAVLKKSGRSASDVLEELVDASARWMAKLTPRARPQPSPTPSSSTPRAGTTTRGSKRAPRK